MADIRLPQINGATEKEMLMQIRSYLYQLAPRLQWALEDINKRQETFSSSNPQAKSQSLPGISSGASHSDPQSTFNSIKALIIKSADIVNAYYQEISEKLEGKYMAVSDFGVYEQSTEALIKKTSEEVGVAFTNIQTINTNVANLDEGIADAKDELNKNLKSVQEGIEDANTSIKAITANIKTGLLDETNGIYGIEVGQIVKVDGVETFNKYARFTSNRLSFYDKNDVEVAYISDYKLYITNAEISGTLKLGGYKVETTNGLAFKWEGRVSNG